MASAKDFAEIARSASAAGKVRLLGADLARYENPRPTRAIHWNMLFLRPSRLGQHRDRCGGHHERLSDQFQFDYGRARIGLLSLRGEMQLCNRVPQNYKFTGKERDTESGLDNFGARYDSSNLGRFLTPDWAERPTAVPYAAFGDPQSLNLYGFVRNDPVSLADADGHACTDMSGPNAMAGCQNGEEQELAEGERAYVERISSGTKAAKAKEAQKPLTAKQIQEKFYKEYGRKFNEAMRAQIKATRPQDLHKYPDQSSATAPKLDITKTRAELGNVESRNYPDVAAPLVQNGTIRIPKETVASGNFNAIAGDYAHELANLVDYQMNQSTLGHLTMERNYGDPNFKDPNTGQPEPDTGAQVEMRMFGSTQY